MGPGDFTGTLEGKNRSLRSTSAHPALFSRLRPCGGYSGTRGEGCVGYRRGGKTIVSEARAMREKARRVLQAAAVEAYGRPGAYVSRHRVMQRTNISDVEEFREIAEYLDRKGWIAEGGDDYGYFVVTPAGIDEATN